MNKPKQITIDGQVYNLVLEQQETEQQETEQQETEQKDTGWGLPESGESYFYIDDTGEIVCETHNSKIDGYRESACTAFTSAKVAHNVARAQKLQSQLLRYAAEHNTVELDWDDSNQKKCAISFDTVKKEFGIDDISYTKEFGQVYFSSLQITKAAIEEFRDELLWYFTEYKTHL